jgi:hypothetical protein
VLDPAVAVARVEGAPVPYEGEVVWYEVASVPYEGAVARVEGAAARADAALVGINDCLLSDNGGACELEDACGIWIPCDSGLGGVAGGVGWANTLPARNITSSVSARIFFILFHL